MHYICDGDSNTKNQKLEFYCHKEKIWALSDFAFGKKLHHHIPKQEKSLPKVERTGSKPVMSLVWSLFLLFCFFCGNVSFLLNRRSN